jgi:PPR repeat
VTTVHVLHNRWQEAVAVVQLMHKDGVQANSFTYTAAIKACSRAGQWQPALALLDSAVAEHAAAEAAAAAEVVVVAAEEQEQEDTAPETVPETVLVRKQKPPTPIVDAAVYNAAIHACGGQAQQLETGVLTSFTCSCTTPNGCNALTVCNDHLHLHCSVYACMRTGYRQLQTTQLTKAALMRVCMHAKTHCNAHNRHGSAAQYAGE